MLASESIVGHGKGSLTGGCVPVSQASTHVGSVELNDHQLRGPIESLIVRFPAPGGRFHPVAFQSAGYFCGTADIAHAMGNHVEWAGAVRKRSQQVAAPAKPLAPTRDPRARFEVVPDGRLQIRVVRAHGTST